MRINEKKENLIKQLNVVNYEYFNKVMNHEAEEDCIGDEKQILFEALRYVPNHILKKWTSRLKKEIKEVVNENTN
ncbi:hypothetical protein HTVC202P_gp10 [Pelagibacter phage HTVC202P]|nr:hypothetical protein HTVC202P_gp10 [Pelagibacter phage HTVC202P]